MKFDRSKVLLLTTLFALVLSVPAFWELYSVHPTLDGTANLYATQNDTTGGNAFSPKVYDNFTLGGNSTIPKCSSSVILQPADAGFNHWLDR